MAKKESRLTREVRNFVLDMVHNETIVLERLKDFLVKQGLKVSSDDNKTLIQILVILAIKEPRILILATERSDTFFFTRR